MRLRACFAQQASLSHSAQVRTVASAAASVLVGMVKGTVLVIVLAGQATWEDFEVREVEERGGLEEGGGKGLGEVGGMERGENASTIGLILQSHFLTSNVCL